MVFERLFACQVRRADNFEEPRASLDSVVAGPDSADSTTLQHRRERHLPVVLDTRVQRVLAVLWRARAQTRMTTPYTNAGKAATLTAMEA